MKSHVERRPWNDEIWIRFADLHPTGQMAVITSFNMTTVEPGEAVPDDAAIKLSHTAAQELVDRLYAAGVRPSDDVKNDGQLAAMREHLGDLRRLVFKEKAPDEPSDTSRSW